MDGSTLFDNLSGEGRPTETFESEPLVGWLVFLGERGARVNADFRDRTTLGLEHREKEKVREREEGERGDQQSEYSYVGG